MWRTAIRLLSRFKKCHSARIVPSRWRNWTREGEDDSTTSTSSHLLCYVVSESPPAHYMIMRRIELQVRAVVLHGTQL